MAPNDFREGLKKPDDFVSFFGHLIGGLAPHFKGLLTVLVVAALFGVGWLTSQWVSGHKDQNAAEALEVVMKASSEPDAALKDVDLFLTKYGSSGVAPQAYLLKGKILMRAGRYSEALDAYKSAAQKWPKPFRYLAEAGEGYALMELKSFAQAETVFKALSEAKDNPLRSEHLWNLGLAQEAQQHPDQALTSYRLFESQYQNSPMLEKVRSRIALLQKK